MTHGVDPQRDEVIDLVYGLVVEVRLGGIVVLILPAERGDASRPSFLVHVEGLL